MPEPNTPQKRLSVLLGDPVSLPSPGTAARCSPTTSPRASIGMGTAVMPPIYEPQALRPYTPDPFPEEPAPAHTTTTTDPEHTPSFSQEPTPVLSTPATFHSAETTLSLPPTPTPLEPAFTSSFPQHHHHHHHHHHTPPKPSTSHSSHPSLESTTSSRHPPLQAGAHSSSDPFSPFYTHPTTRTSPSPHHDHHALKAPSPTASKTALVHIYPCPSNSNSGSNSGSATDLEASVSTLPAHPYPACSSSHQLGAARSGSAAGRKSCALLRLEGARKQRGVAGRWRRMRARTRLGVKILLGVVIAGGAIGLAVGLWWRFARLQ